VGTLNLFTRARNIHVSEVMQDSFCKIDPSDDKVDWLRGVPQPQYPNGFLRFIGMALSCSVASAFCQ
jgi:hypothetical protein